MSVVTQVGYSALMFAAMMGKTEVVVELVKAGANVDMQDRVCQYFFKLAKFSLYVSSQQFSQLIQLGMLIRHVVD